MADLDTERYRAAANEDRHCDDPDCTLGGCWAGGATASLCDEIDRLRARLAEVEAERDQMLTAYNAQFARTEEVVDRLMTAESRLAGVEAVRDRLYTENQEWRTVANGQAARLAAVEALCDVMRKNNDPYASLLEIALGRAAARGEGDRPVADHVAIFDSSPEGTDR